MRYIGDYAEAPLIGASLLVHFESEYLNMWCTGCWRKKHVVPDGKAGKLLQPHLGRPGELDEVVGRSPLAGLG